MTNPLSALPPVIRGPLWMIIAGLGYTLASACTRQMSTEYSTVQLAFLRCLIAVFFIAPMLFRNGVGVLKTSVFPMHLFRGVITYGAMLTWFYAVSVIPVSDYTALLYSQPIFTILFAVLLKPFLIEAYMIPTPSMQPTMMGSREASVHDRLLVDKLCYAWGDPERWDIAVFRYPIRQIQS